MSINLSDIPAAVADYLNTQVTVDVSEVTPTSGSLNPNELGSFRVTVTNIGEVRLTDVKYHVQSSAPTIALLKVPSGAAIFPRATTDPNDPLLPRNTFVDNMVLFLVNTALEPGEVETIGLELKGIDEGDATITCHIHGDIDQVSLFPHGENSPNGRRPVTVS